MCVLRTIVFVFVSVTSFGIQEISSARYSQHSARIAPIQLKGLESIFLGAYVDNSIPRYQDLAERIKSRASKMLAETGLSLEGEQGATLFIDVTLYPIKDGIQVGYAIAEVHTMLREKVSLCRDPSLKLPNNAVTWEWKWVELIKRGNLGVFVEEEALDQVRIFCDEWSHVKRLEGKWL